MAQRSIVKPFPICLGSKMLPTIADFAKALSPEQKTNSRFVGLEGEDLFMAVLNDDYLRKVKVDIESNVPLFAYNQFKSAGKKLDLNQVPGFLLGLVLFLSGKNVEFLPSPNHFKSDFLGELQQSLVGSLGEVFDIYKIFYREAEGIVESAQSFQMQHANFLFIKKGLTEIEAKISTLQENLIRKERDMIVNALLNALTSLKNTASILYSNVCSKNINFTDANQLIVKMQSSVAVFEEVVEFHLALNKLAAHAMQNIPIRLMIQEIHKAMNNFVYGYSDPKRDTLGVKNTLKDSMLLICDAEKWKTANENREWKTFLSAIESIIHRLFTSLGITIKRPTTIQFFNSPQEISPYFFRSKLGDLMLDVGEKADRVLAMAP